MNATIYEFGPFRLDRQNRRLQRGPETLGLTPKVFDVLLVLVERHGQLVLKDELLKAVWPNTHVTEANLSQAVFVLRKTLGETPDHRFIFTVAGSGYRFTGDVRVVSPAPVPEAPPAPPAPPVVRDLRHVRPSAWRGALVAVAAVVLIASGAFALRWARGESGAPVADGKTLLAVLPFANLTGEAAQDYFADGLTEEMISQVGNVDPSRLGVIARTSVMRFKDRRSPLAQIQRELGVQYVLDGSVRRDPQQVRITAQLVRVRDQSQLWSRQYDRDLSNLLAVQADIARDVAGAISRTLVRPSDAEDASRRQPMSPDAIEAYDLYLRGRHHLAKRTREGLAEAAASFDRAIARDATYARAHAGLADAYVLTTIYGFGPAVELMPKARSAALRALALDDSLAEAHASLALIAQSYDWDLRTAEREYLRAAELNPNYATAHHWYAELLAFQGRFAEAETASARSRQLDPLSLIIAADHGAILYFSRQYDRAIAELRAVLDAQPGFPRAKMIVYAHAQAGQFAQGLAETARWPAHEAWTIAAQGYLYGRQGRVDAARAAARRIEGPSEGNAADTPVMLAVVYAGMNDADRAMASLQRAYREHSPSLMTLKVEPIFDPLRADPRFQELVRLVGLK